MIAIRLNDDDSRWALSAFKWTRNSNRRLVVAPCLLSTDILHDCDAIWVSQCMSTLFDNRTKMCLSPRSVAKCRLFYERCAMDVGRWLKCIRWKLHKLRVDILISCISQIMYLFSLESVNCLWIQSCKYLLKLSIEWNSYLYSILTKWCSSTSHKNKLKVFSWKIKTLILFVILVYTGESVTTQ